MFTPAVSTAYWLRIRVILMASPPNTQGGNPSNPLASVITQVSPTGPNAGAVRPGAPTRPVRVPRNRAPEPSAQGTSGQAPAVPATINTQPAALSALGPVASLGQGEVPHVSVTGPDSVRPLRPPALQPTEDQPIPPEPTEKPATLRAKGPRPVSAPVPATVRAVTPPETTTSAPAAPIGERPRGFRRFLAMMKCSGKATHEAAVSEQPPSSTARAAPRPSVAGQAPQPPVTSSESTDQASQSRKEPSTRPKSAPVLPMLQPIGGTPLPASETQSVTSGAVVAPGTSLQPPEEDSYHDYDSSEHTDDAPDAFSFGYMQDVLSEQDIYAEEQRLIQQGGNGIPIDENGVPRPLLSTHFAQDWGRKCLVLDLDETLVHSSFKLVPNADFVVNVEIDGTMHNVYVIKRPGVDEFLRAMGRVYEVVVFTASLNKYADPVLDILDVHDSVRHRLFRESCYNHHGNYVKDLSQLGRPLRDTIILDNSPASYIFHPANAVPVSSWFNDPHDTELTDLCPFLEDLCHVQDVRVVLDGFNEHM